jgi:hypothetical protein
VLLQPAGDIREADTMSCYQDMRCYRGSREKTDSTVIRLTEITGAIQET